MAYRVTAKKGDVDISRDFSSQEEATALAAQLKHEGYVPVAVTEIDVEVATVWHGPGTGTTTSDFA